MCFCSASFCDRSWYYLFLVPAFSNIFLIFILEWLIQRRHLNFCSVHVVEKIDSKIVKVIKWIFSGHKKVSCTYYSKNCPSSIMDFFLYDCWTWRPRVMSRKRPLLSASEVLTIKPDVYIYVVDRWGFFFYKTPMQLLWTYHIPRSTVDQLSTSRQENLPSNTRYITDSCFFYSVTVNWMFDEFYDKKIKYSKR